MEEPVLGSPDLLLRVLDHRMDGAHDARAVLGVQMVIPPGDMAGDLGEPVAEGRIEGIVPIQLVGGQIPIPDDVVRGQVQQTDALLVVAQPLVGELQRRNGLLQARLGALLACPPKSVRGLLALVDVSDGSHKAHGPATRALSLEEGLAPDLDPVHRGGEPPRRSCPGDARRGFR